MNEEIPTWLISISDELFIWLWSLQVDNQPGWFRFCREGALFEPDERAGLGISCLVLKTFHMLNLTQRLPDGYLTKWTQRIQSFQTKRGRFTGFFEDPALLRPLDQRAGWFKYDLATRRAETRQACATLLCVGARPLVPISKLPATVKGVQKFIQELPWEIPWAAGSHTGHLMAFLHINAKFFGQSSTANNLLPVVIQQLDNLRDEQTGSWFRGPRPSPQQVINGAMKVISGYSFCGLPFGRVNHLIDYCLASINDEHGCDNADIVFVLHQCHQLTHYREEEIQHFARNRLEEIKHFRAPDGGFSFAVGQAQTHYYSVPMSRGLPEGDIHGTTLFVWTLVMLADILGWRTKLGWQLPIT
ncbi:MAG: hypothetical protein BroJett011_45930 [Chloroflexota bacterium]|nr:MAG: hypothetical protein BroJett011_45930 [Chloroflexota bacterium]